MTNDNYEPLTCNACGSDEIMYEVFEDEDIYWCSHCGREKELHEDKESPASSVS